MKITALKIRHTVCAGCGGKKFVFVGKSDFCGDCLDEHLDLVVRSNDFPNREIIPGALSDMHDCLTPGGIDASGYSAAFREAISRRECVAASTKQHDHASGMAHHQADEAAQNAYDETLAAHPPNSKVPKVAFDIARRAYNETYRTKYKEVFEKIIAQTPLE